MLKLLKDKQNEFSCELQIEGAPSSASIARLYLANSGYEVVFQGKIQNNICTIPIGKAASLHLPDSGNLRLEVVVEDTVFTPYEGRYEVEQSKSVKMVEVKTAPVHSGVSVSMKRPESNKVTKLQEMLASKGFSGTARSLVQLIKRPEVKRTILEFCENNDLDVKDTISKLIVS